MCPHRPSSSSTHTLYRRWELDAYGEEAFCSQLLLFESVLRFSDAFKSPTNGKIERMRDSLTITLWFTKIPNLHAFVLGGVVAGLISAVAIRLLTRLSGGNPGYKHVDEITAPPGHMAELYVAAWRDRRRRFFVFNTVQFSFFALMFILFIVAQKHPYVSSRVVLLVFGSWFISYIAAGVWLNRFRCPRCRKLYYWRWDVKGSVERQKRWRDCHYCGLQQDQNPSEPIAESIGSSR